MSFARCLIIGLSIFNILKIVDKERNPKIITIKKNLNENSSSKAIKTIFIKMNKAIINKNN